MTPANDNIDPTRHAQRVLHQVLGKEARQWGTEAHTRLLVGLAYARPGDNEERDATLSVAEVTAVARAVLREGQDLTTAGRALGPYKTEVQARAWAAAKLECALTMLQWHPQRMLRDSHNARLVERINVLKAQNATLISKLVA
jgi:hypothetical protein